MATDIDMRVLELVCSRLCHDLVGPVGAVNNGIELLEDFDPSMADDVLPLLQNSARQAWRRLDFFRLTFGAAGGRDSWAMAELGRCAAGWFEGGKVALDWPNDPRTQGVELEATRAKLLLHLTLIAGEALPRGGTVAIVADGGPVPTVTADGRGAALHPQVDAALRGAAIEELDARSIQAHVAILMAGRAGVDIVVEPGADKLSLRSRAAA